MSAKACTSVDVAGTAIGRGHPCFVIAEAGVNHNGSLELARQLVDVAAAAGANAIKFQTFRAEKVISRVARKAPYQARTTDPAQSQLDMVRSLELPFEAFRELQRRCQDKGVLFLSTPFDEESADFLEELGVAAFKVASGELTNLPFLAHLSRKRRSMIVSTGMSWLGEVENAVRCVWENGDPGLVLLHCVSNYPADPSQANLAAMDTMAAAFGVPVGYSDHTPGIEVALAAVALGACVLEKHFTLDRNLQGPDHRASLEPSELLALCRGVRVVESALGDGRKQPAAAEAETAAVARRSLVAARDLAAGTVLTRDLVAIKRPGTGLAPSMLPLVLGRRLREAAPADTLLTWQLLS